MFKKVALVLTCVVALCLTACAGGEPGKETEPQVEYATFAEHTDLEIFKDVPCFTDMSRITVKDADDYGDENYVLALAGTFPAQFKDYLQILENAGFTKVADNGATGIDKTVLSSYYQKDGLTLNVAFSSGDITTYISASKTAEVSPYLTNDPSRTQGIIEGAQTTLYMHQVPEYGNCFVIQLKNGHYIVNDGGIEGNLRPLVDYLVENAPEGQKAVVEAWFISHEHGDHVGVFKEINSMYDINDKIAVEGVYLSQVSNMVKTNVGSSAGDVGTVYVPRSYLKTTAGEMTPIYRPHLGDRYYFSDIIVEVPYTQEQFPLRRYTDNLNPSSTWLMYNIEGQKFLLSGDTEESNMKDVSEMYDASYMDVDIMSLHHHSLNVYTENLGYFQVETMLYSTWGVYSIYWPKETLQHNLTIQREYCQEYFSYLEGGRKLTFPYTIGSAETLEPWYPETTTSLVERQAGWLKDAGLTYPIAK